MKKQLYIGVCFTFLFCTIHAQNSPKKVNELGLGFTSINNYSLQYRWGNETRMFRITGSVTGLMGGSSNNNNNNIQTDTSQTSTVTKLHSSSPFNMTATLNLSMLHIKPIFDKEKFGLVYGPMIGASYNYLHNRNSSTIDYYTASVITKTLEQESTSTGQTIKPYLGFVFGLMYKITNNIIIYGEVAPNIYYSYFTTYSKITNKTIYNAGFSTTISKNKLDNQSYNYGISNLTNSNAMITIVYRFYKDTH